MQKPQRAQSQFTQRTAEKIQNVRTPFLVPISEISGEVLHLASFHPLPMKLRLPLLSVLTYLFFFSSAMAQWSCADDVLDSIAKTSIPRYDEIFQHENQKLHNYI